MASDISVYFSISPWFFGLSRKLVLSFHLFRSSEPQLNSSCLKYELEVSEMGNHNTSYFPPPQNSLYIGVWWSFLKSILCSILYWFSNTLDKSLYSRLGLNLLFCFFFLLHEVTFKPVTSRKHSKPDCYIQNITVCQMKGAVRNCETSNVG